jgi:hypothetical protein
MRAILLILVLGFFSLNAAHASVAEVREVARQHNCPPKKIEVLRQAVGDSGETVYQVECALPTAKSPIAGAATNLQIRCALQLCQAMR